MNWETGRNGDRGVCLYEAASVAISRPALANTCLFLASPSCLQCPARGTLVGRPKKSHICSFSRIMESQTGLG